MPVLTNAEKTAYDAQVTNNTGTSSGTNTGDQTSIAGITGTIAQFNTAITDGSMATGGGTATGTNTGDQASIAGITGTTAQFNTALSDGSFATGGGTATGTNTGDQDISLMVESDVTGVTGADAVTNMMSLTQAEYNAITTPDASTFYIIVN